MFINLLFLEIKQNQLRSVITHPKYVTCLTICIDLIKKVKSLRRKLNFLKETLCFAIFKKYRICTSHFLKNLKIALQNAKCDASIRTLCTSKNIMQHDIILLGEFRCLHIERAIKISQKKLTILYIYE